MMKQDDDGYEFFEEFTDETVFLSKKEALSLIYPI